MEPVSSSLTSAQRTRAAFSRSQLPDRVPVHAYLGLPLLQEMLGIRSRAALLRLLAENPNETVIHRQRELGLDPIFTSYSQHLGEAEAWPARLLRMPRSTDGWEETVTSTDLPDDQKAVEHQIRTPVGTFRYAYRYNGHGTVSLTRLLEGPEPEARLVGLRYRPACPQNDLEPLRSLAKALPGDTWWMHYVVGPWGLAAEVRGIDALLTDLFDRPTFVHELMDWATGWICSHLHALAPLRPPSICINESWVGVGLSPRLYRSFVLPYDRKCVTAAHTIGALVSYHNCGRGRALIEDMLATGADALETLTPPQRQGDFDLEETRQRVGLRCCLMGGFDDRVLSDSNHEVVRSEVDRCLHAAAGPGGYILRPAGQVMFAAPGSIETMCSRAREIGAYAQGAAVVAGRALPAGGRAWSQ